MTAGSDPPDEAEMGRRRAEVLGRQLPWLVAERDGVVLGYAYANYFRPRMAYRFCLEDSIYLRQDIVGKGLGSRLLDELMVQSRAAGFTQMIAVITAERANSVRVHEKAGFHHVGVYKEVGFKFDRWLDIVHMQKAL